MKNTTLEPQALKNNLGIIVLSSKSLFKGMDRLNALIACRSICIDNRDLQLGNSTLTSILSAPNDIEGLVLVFRVQFLRRNSAIGTKQAHITSASSKYEGYGFITCWS